MIKIRNLLNTSFRLRSNIRNLAGSSSNINEIREEFTRQSTCFEKVYIYI
jgi:hypothetical protein